MKALQSFFLLCISILLDVTASNGQWIQIQDNNSSVSCFAVSGRDLFEGYGYGGIFLSTDNGSNWNAVNTGLDSTKPVFEIVVAGSKLFAATEGAGVYLSTDNGRNWNPRNSGLAIGGTYMSCLAVNDTYLFAGSDYDGVLASSDDGAHWIKMSNGLPTDYENLGIRSLAVSDSFLFVGTYGDGVFSSTNNGGIWNAANTGLTSVPSRFVQKLFVHNNNLYAGTLNGVYLSTDNGANWSAINSGMTQTSIEAMAASGNKLLAGTWGNGVFLSTDNGTHWSTVNSGLTNWLIQTLAVNDSYFFAGARYGVLRRSISDMVASVSLPSVKPPTEFYLEQNFPNPFNPSTTIVFGLPSRSFVNLKIIDILGKEIETLASEELAEGVYKRHWNAVDKPSGTYFCRIQAGDFVETRIMILLK